MWLAAVLLAVVLLIEYELLEVTLSPLYAAVKVCLMLHALSFNKNLCLSPLRLYSYCAYPRTAMAHHHSRHRECIFCLIV